MDKEQLINIYLRNDVYLDCTLKTRECSPTHSSLFIHFSVKKLDNKMLTWDFVLIISTTLLYELNLIVFIMDFARNIILTDNVLYAIGLPDYVHFRNRINQEELDKLKDLREEEFEKTIKINNIILLKGIDFLTTPVIFDELSPNIERFRYKASKSTVKV